MGISSNIQICNNALLRLGNNTIASFSDGTTESDACQNLYDSTRKLLLRQFQWNFATTRVALAASGTTPIFGYANQFPLPSDYVRLVGIWQQSSDYAIENYNGTPMLLTNDGTPLQIKYIQDITDTTKMDDIFIEVLTLWLAIKLGWRLTGVGFNPGTMANELKESLAMAKLIDSQDQSPPHISISSYEDAMFTGFSSAGGYLDPTQQGMNGNVGF